MAAILDHRQTRSRNQLRQFFSIFQWPGLVVSAVDDDSRARYRLDAVPRVDAGPHRVLLSEEALGARFMHHLPDGLQHLRGPGVRRGLENLQETFHHFVETPGPDGLDLDLADGKPLWGIAPSGGADECQPNDALPCAAEDLEGREAAEGAVAPPNE